MLDDYQFSTVFERTDGESVWVSFKRSAGETSVHGELTCNGVASNGCPYVFPSEGFTVKHVSKRSLTLSYEDVESTFVAPLTTYATVHNQRKSVECMDVTSGGLAVSADVTGKCHVWTTDNGEVRRSLEGHCGDVYTCGFFPSGVVLMTGGADTQLKIWSAETGDCAATLTGHQAGITCTSIVERGRNVVSASRDGTARLWDCGTQRCLATYSPEAGVVNGCCLGVAGDGIGLGQPEETPSEREVSTDGKMLLLATEEGRLVGYGLRSKQQVFDIPCGDAVNCCCFLSDVTAVCGTQSSELYVIDLRSPGQPLKRIRESRAAILSLLPYKNGVFASTGDGSCFFTDEDMRTRVELSGADCDPVYKVVSDGKYIYTCCRDSYIRKYAVPL